MYKAYCHSLGLLKFGLNCIFKKNSSSHYKKGLADGLRELGIKEDTPMSALQSPDGPVV
jgi:hypothetical protein